MESTLKYVHDPMCSWCVGFSRAYDELIERLPPDLKIERILGGLAPDTDVIMPDSMQMMLQQTWHRIEQVIPGVEFNFDFWDKCEPKRSTYPACRAIIAAREQGTEYDLVMTRQIQKAYYQQARNPSENQTLIELAGEIGLDVSRFSEELTAPETQQQLLAEINKARSMGIDGFPSLVLDHNGYLYRVLVNYNEVDPMLDQINTDLGA